MTSMFSCFLFFQELSYICFCDCTRYLLWSVDDSVTVQLFSCYLYFEFLLSCCSYVPPSLLVLPTLSLISPITIISQLASSIIFRNSSKTISSAIFLSLRSAMCYFFLFFHFLQPLGQLTPLSVDWASHIHLCCTLYSLYMRKESEKPNTNVSWGQVGNRTQVISCNGKSPLHHSNYYIPKI